MAAAVSLDQAAANALATYLRGRFTPLGGVYASPSLEVLPDWPDTSRRLPPLAISVITAGPWDQGDWWAPEVLSRVDVTASTSTYVWEVTDVEQPIQLDVWATTAADRVDLVKRLVDFLHAGIDVTLNLRGDPTAPSLLLAMGDGWLGKADFLFDAPDLSDTEDAAGQSEYRATFRGRALLSLQLSATAARMKTIKLKQLLHEGAAAAQGDLFNIMTVTSTATTHTKGP